MSLNKMEVDIYQGDDSLHSLLFPKGMDVEKCVPQAVRESFTNLKKWKTRTIEEGRPLVAASPSGEILNNLVNKGYHEQRSKIVIEEIPGGRPPAAR